MKYRMEIFLKKKRISFWSFETYCDCNIRETKKNTRDTFKIMENILYL